MTQMGRGTFRPGQLRHHSGAVRTFLSRTGQNRNWLTALDDHPALVERRKYKDGLTPQPDDSPSTPTLSCKAQPIEDGSTGHEDSKCQEVEVVDEQGNKLEEVWEEMEVVEVYERDELLAAISSWLMLVSDRARVPWPDGEAEERSHLFAKALLIAGILHMLDNIGKDLHTHMKLWDGMG